MGSLYQQSNDNNQLHTLIAATGAYQGYLTHGM
jgi:hypothetical protein